jgi:homoaconitase/3-isopropylmalate dehydratase large subunit
VQAGGQAGMCAPQSTTSQYRRTDGDGAIAADSANQLDRNWGWEAESKMRVASLESVLAVATLVSAIVVVLWGIKIFYSV